jgi:hypothetical protein
MTLTLAIIINVLLGIVLVGLVAFCVSLASKLTPHVAGTPDAPGPPAGPPARPRAGLRAERLAARRHPVLD